MSYLAIARKYRPGTFADMVGQEHVVRTLTNALEGGRVHHAYLFCGARGVGKTTAARAFAKALNCERGPTPSPCGSCGSCLEIASGASPDLIEIDGASNNSVEDIRELRDTVGYAPTRGRFKIYLVDEVHMLSKAAFNALLKTLEEPPPHVVFLFATTEPNRILDTILSRVQRFDFKRIPLEATAARLREIAAAEGVTLSDHALRLVARAGEGSMRDAQSLLDKVISAVGRGASPTDAEVAATLGLVDRGALFEFLAGLLAGEPERCLRAIAAVDEYGHEMSEFSTELLELLRHATFVRMSAEARRHVDLSADEVERLVALVEGAPTDRLVRLFHALLDVHDQVSRAARPRIVLEMAVARLAAVRAAEPVSQLLARLEDLERRLRGGGGGSGGGGPAPRTPTSRGSSTRGSPGGPSGGPGSPGPLPPRLGPSAEAAPPRPEASAQSGPPAPRPDLVPLASPAAAPPREAAPAPDDARRPPRPAGVTAQEPASPGSSNRADPASDDAPPAARRRSAPPSAPPASDGSRSRSTRPPKRAPPDAPTGGPPFGGDVPLADHLAGAGDALAEPAALSETPESVAVWNALLGPLRALPEPLPLLAEARPAVRHRTLVLQFPAGAKLARARKAAALPAFRGLLDGRVPAWELGPVPGTESPAEALAELEREVRADPVAQRILSVFGAELDRSRLTDLRGAPVDPKRP